jgi:hypothetical protein
LNPLQAQTTNLGFSKNNATLQTYHDRRIVVVVRINSMSDAMQYVEDAQLEQLSCIAPATRKGRQTSDVWQLFPTDESPQLPVLVLRSACCMHCKVEVTYMKKSERVKSHLLNSKSFITVMMSMDLAERPDWLNEESKPNRFHRGLVLLSYTLPSRPYNHRRLARRSFRRSRIILPCTITSQDLLSFESKRGPCWKHSRLLGQM